MLFFLLNGLAQMLNRMEHDRIMLLPVCWDCNELYQNIYYMAMEMLDLALLNISELIMRNMTFYFDFTN